MLDQKRTSGRLRPRTCRWRSFDARRARGRGPCGTGAPAPAKRSLARRCRSPWAAAASRCSRAWTCASGAARCTCCWGPTAAARCARCRPCGGSPGWDGALRSSSLAAHEAPASVGPLGTHAQISDGQPAQGGAAAPPPTDRCGARRRRWPAASMAGAQTRASMNCPPPCDCAVDVAQGAGWAGAGGGRARAHRPAHGLCVPEPRPPGGDAHGGGGRGLRAGQVRARARRWAVLIAWRVMDEQCMHANGWDAWATMGAARASEGQGGRSVCSARRQRAQHDEGPAALWHGTPQHSSQRLSPEPPSRPSASAGRLAQPPTGAAPTTQ